MYMRSIYWQAMPKVKKKSDKQRQRLYKVRKRYERATNEKEVQLSKTCVEKSGIPRVDVHVQNNNLVFAAAYVFLLFETLPADYMLKSFYFLWVDGWVEVCVCVCVCGGGGGGGGGGGLINQYYLVPYTDL